MSDKALRQHLADLLNAENAHASFKKAVAGLDPKLRTERPAGSPHSIWELVEHIRIAQWDILEFSRDAKHKSPQFPEGYWPAKKAPTEADWKESLRNFDRDLGAMTKLVLNPKSDLFAKIRHGDGQTLLREALLVADHNAYHTGEIVILRRLLNAWPH